ALNLQILRDGKSITGFRISVSEEKESRRDLETLLHSPTVRRLQLCFHHLVKRPDILIAALCQPAMDFHGRKQLVPIHAESQRGELFSRIGLNRPVAAKAPPHYLAEIAAPDLAGFGQVVRRGRR